ncbi:hypothetical protein HPB47_027858 [Ixodes persulcatus]|uniref:Uncharacterized protein n=1 Tax=Ixodes persulcatus TaxID=34615 RepID=A0AC60PWG7_IXOPE|nr:hypothetical protein HPB47_027858 [Ixodes persulcatus]
MGDRERGRACGSGQQLLQFLLDEFTDNVTDAVEGGPKVGSGYRSTGYARVTLASSCIRLPGHGVQNTYPESTTKTSKYESDGSFGTRSTPTTKIDTDSTTSRPL